MLCFNTTGPCVPNLHYMADISDKIAQVRTMIDAGKYFTINRGRQYGKTTTLAAIRRDLGDDYIVLSLSFEGLGKTAFDNEAAFAAGFMQTVKQALRFSSISKDKEYIRRWVNPGVQTFLDLSEHITDMCEDHKIVMLIDEVDASSNYQVFISFLGMLRDKYIKRTLGTDFTFHSVILAGVYDIKNIKSKMISHGVYTPAPEEGVVYNSPWNIAANFDVDMSLNPEEIATMLNEYEKDHHTGMDVEALAKEIHRWTSGYPFLVSRICQLMDEKIKSDWTVKAVNKAVKMIIKEQNTLFDDMVKNLEMFPELYRYVYDLLIVGVDKRESLQNPVINRGLMFCFLRIENSKIRVHNKIFERVLSDYFVSKDDTSDTKAFRPSGVLKYDVVKDGKFDMELALRKFAEYYERIYSTADAPFLERNGRMVFLSFLMPLINGEGFYHIESQLTDLRRMDIVVDFGNDEFIIELKLWRGPQAEEKAYDQLRGYLQSRKVQTGYLLCFDLRKDKKQRQEWVETNGCKVFEVVI